MKRETSCCFTGHRPDKLPWRNDESDPRCVRLKEEILTLTGVSDEDMHLEQWAFEECAPFFEEVFGIKPQFIMKTLMF